MSVSVTSRKINRRTVLKASSGFAASIAGGAIVPAAAATSISFGRLTGLGQGGYTMPAGASLPQSADNAIFTTYFNIVGGRLVPKLSLSGAPAVVTGKVVVGTIVQDWNVAIDDNVYSCATGQLQAILDVVGNSLGGKTIRGRAGADICGSVQGSLVEFKNTLDLTATGTLTITSDDPVSKCFMRRAVFKHYGPVHIKDVTITDNFIPSSDTYGVTTMLNFVTPLNGTKRSEVTLERCLFYTRGVAELTETYLNEFEVYSSGTDISYTANSTVVTLPNATNLGNIATDGTYTVSFNNGTSFRKIIGINLTTSEVTMHADAGSVALANYKIFKTPKIIDGIRENGAAKPKLIVRNCEFRSLQRAITGTIPIWRSAAQVSTIV